jgi:hypothetical protein
VTRIVGLKAENIKRLKAIELTPNEFINRISGANGSGKTSILDSIEWALTGTSTVPKQPVRKGSGRAVIQLDLGDVIVTRRFVEGGSRNGTLTIEAKDTKSLFKGPQEMLDNLMGSFDPLAFLRMHPDKQLGVLKSLVKFDTDVDVNLKPEQEPDYLRRREAKKEKLAVETRRDAVYVPDSLPKAKVDEAGLVEELKQVSTFNYDIETEQRRRDDFSKSQNILSRDIDEQMEQVAELRRKADELQAEADQWAKQLEINHKSIDKWKPLAELKDAAKLAEQIDAARKVNSGIDRRNLRDGYQNEVDALEVEIETLSASLREIEEKKAKALAEAEYPVPGLAFGEDEVIYRGYPFNQISNAEQIRCAVAIGMASNPELRVMRIKDGSLLDNKAIAILAEMCKAHDYQVFLEMVDTSGKIGVYLEDGEVEAVNPEPLNDPKEVEKPRASKKRTKI